MVNSNSASGPVRAPVAQSTQRLALRMDVAMANAEALAMPPTAWQTHFNAGYHNGGWQAIALRESCASALDIAPGDHALETYFDNETMAACPAISHLVAQISCPLKSVRLLRLASGGVISEHTDAGVSLESGEVRLSNISCVDSCI